VSALRVFQIDWDSLLKCISAAIGFALIDAAATAGSAPAELGKPTIFWHNNEWEVFTNGAWLPYSAPRQNGRVNQSSQRQATYPQPSFGPPFDPGWTNGTEDYPADADAGVGGYGYGYYGVPYGVVVGPDWHAHRGRFRGPHGFAHVPGTTIRHPVAGMGAPNTGIGQPNVVIGKRTLGIGQPTISIGQPNGIGQTTIGIGQPIGMDRASRSGGGGR
jgi:hypothetical protein